MTLRDINHEIRESALSGTQQFLYKFLDHENQIIDDLRAFDGLQSDIYLNHSSNELEQVKFGAIFSDFMSMYSGAHREHESHFTYFDKESPYARDLKITIPGTLTHEINQTSNLLPCYAHSNSDDLKSAAKRFDALIESNKAMLRPIRSLWVDHNHIKDEKRGVIYYAQPNTSPKHWTIMDSFSRESLPISSYLQSAQAQTMLDLTLPYFRNTDLINLTKVLEEERDVLGGFRKELKNIVMNFDEVSSSLQEIRQDVIRPEIEKINRQFKHHKNVHSLKVLGGVGMFSLSLVKLVVLPGTISDVVSSIIGSTGLSTMMVSEIQYQNEMNKLRDNPYFLLWKLKRIGK